MGREGRDYWEAQLSEYWDSGLTIQEYSELKELPYESTRRWIRVLEKTRQLATTRFNGEHAPWIDGTVMPVVWTRHYGKGRVFYSSLGHNLEDFERTPQILEILLRGLFWAMR